MLDNKKLIYILSGAIAFAVFLTVILIIKNMGGGGAGGSASLEFWGVYDKPDAFEKAIRDFETANQGVRINYRQFSYEDYERNLINALAAGSGPDIVMIHNTWLPKHKDKLTPMPVKIKSQKEPLMTTRDFQSQFVDVTAADLVDQNQIYAMPLYVDTLALYYNKDLFNVAGITRPPVTWEEFNQDVENLTRFGPNGEIIQSGAALGTARNINRSTDILMAMMIQSGVAMTDTEHNQAFFTSIVNNIPVGERAVQYYTDFANPSVRTYTWNDSGHYSIDAFIEGKTAMMFNYSHQVEVLKAKAPRLNFDIASMPQASASDIKNFANYWAAAVSNKSQHPEEAWRFITYLTSKEGITNYLNGTGRPAARRDLIELQRNEDEIGIFALQALTAKSWYQADNLAIETIFADMIDEVNFKRSSIQDALRSAESKINVLMSKR